MLGPDFPFSTLLVGYKWRKAVYGTTNSGFAPLKVSLQGNGELLEINSFFKMFLIKFVIDC